MTHGCDKKTFYRSSGLPREACELALQISIFHPFLRSVVVFDKDTGSSGPCSVGWGGDMLPLSIRRDGYNRLINVILVAMNTTVAFAVSASSMLVAIFAFPATHLSVTTADLIKWPKEQEVSLVIQMCGTRPFVTPTRAAVSHH